LFKKCITISRAKLPSNFESTCYQNTARGKTMTDAQQKSAAKQFAADWKDKG
jgi:hypothetical protein